MHVLTPYMIQREAVDLLAGQRLSTFDPDFPKAMARVQVLLDAGDIFRIVIDGKAHALPCKLLLLDLDNFAQSQLKPLVGK